MANPLTGDFDAVVQVSLRQINGLLAALHQNGVDSDTTLKLLHSVRSRIGDPRRRRDLGAFGDWVFDLREARPPDSRLPLRNHLLTGPPPGLAKRLEAAFRDLDDLVIEPAPPEVVRGLAA